MKKTIAILTAVLGTSSVMPNFTVSAYAGTYDYVKEQYLEMSAKSDADWELFDEYLTYSLDVDDYDSLTDEKKALCRFIFETERSYMPDVYCLYARNALSGQNTSGRVSFDEPQTIASVVDPAPSYYSFFSNNRIVPDIVYAKAYDVYSEYWLDDEGTERIILNGGNPDEFEYVKFYDEMPADTENIMTSDNGEVYVYCETKYKNDYKNDYSIERLNSDTWEYVIVPDGTAVITGCTLPHSSEVVPIEEPVVIPGEIDGHTVSGIDGAVVGTGITKLVISENIRYISSVSGMNYLTEVEINAPELELGNGSFISCPELKTARLNVKSIVGTPFMNCPKLESLYIDGAERIHTDAFCDMPSLSRVTLPDNLEVIGQCAFTGTSVKELELPRGLKKAGLLKFPYYYGFDEFTDTLVEDDLLIADADCTIKGYYDSEAHKYAVSHNMRFVSLDDILYGDANGDGEIGISDLVAVQNYLLGNRAVGYEADINKDGRIDSFDMIMTRKKLIEKQ